MVGLDGRCSQRGIINVDHKSYIALVSARAVGEPCVLLADHRRPVASGPEDQEQT